MGKLRHWKKMSNSKFYKIAEPVIKFEGVVNENQYVLRSTAEIAEEQAKDGVWREVICWVEQGQP